MKNVRFTKWLLMSMTVTVFFISACATLEVKNRQLMDAVVVGNSETASALIKAGANVNVRNEGGRTALMRAAYMGHTETVSALINAGADVNAKEEFGVTALMAAANSGHTEIVDMLKRAGAKE